MLDDLLKSTKQTIAERLASPLLGSFIVAWALWNYKFLVILSSSAGVTKTFELIETLAFPTAWSVLLRGIAFPLISALLYVFLYPYPARFVYEFTQRRQKEILEIRKKIDNETPLTLEESRKIRDEYALLERKNQEELDRLNEEIAKLKAALTADSPSPSAKLDAAEVLYGQLEPNQYSILQLLNSQGGEALHTELVEKSSQPKINAEFDIGELERRKLIHKDFDQGSRDYKYTFTQDGRRVYLNNGKLGA